MAGFVGKIREHKLKKDYSIIQLIKTINNNKQ